MSFKVIETNSSSNTREMIQLYSKKGFVVVTNKKNNKGGATLTFKTDPKKQSPTDGIRLAAWIVGLIELILTCITIVSMILLILQGTRLQNNEFCQEVIQEIINQGGKDIPSIADLNDLGKIFFLVGIILAGLCLVALIPLSWTVAKVRKSNTQKHLCGLAVVGIVSLGAIPTAVMLLVVRSKQKAIDENAKKSTKTKKTKKTKK